MDSLSERITQWLEPKLTDSQAFLVELRILPAQQRIEVYLDRDAGLPGIDIDTCAEVNRYLRFQLDHSGDPAAQYALEVSSPGMDNPFRVLRQYLKYRGSRVEVLLLDGRKMEGLLVDAGQEGIVLDHFLRGSESPSPAKGPLRPRKKVEELPTERLEFSYAQIKATKRKFDF
jgi:ribosome maturation factor RimP